MRNSFSFLPSSALWNAELIPPGSAEKKIYFLCELCGSSEVPQGRDKRAVKNMLSLTRIAKLGLLLG